MSARYRIFLHAPICESGLMDILIGPASAAGMVKRPGLWLTESPEAGAVPSLVAGQGPSGTPGAVLGLLLDVDEDELRRLDRFMAFQGACRRTLQASVPQDAPEQGYFRDLNPDEDGPEPWQPDLWDPRRAAIARHAAREMLDLDADRLHRPATTDRLGNILVRAAATERALRSARPRHAKAPGRDTVEVQRERVSHDGFFQTRTLTLRHPRFDGQKSDWMERETFMAADAVTVLPYDPVRDRVLLAEQFRASLYLRGESHPWSIEPLAGRIDPGEQPEAAARREVREEAGLEVGALERIGGYYPATGTTTEYIVSYLAIADLPDDVGGLGGEVAEGEDIRTFVLGFDEAMSLLHEDEARNAPLMISLFRLASRRDALRTQAGQAAG